MIQTDRDRELVSQITITNPVMNFWTQSLNYILIPTRYNKQKIEIAQQSRHRF